MAGKETITITVEDEKNSTGEFEIEWYWKCGWDLESMDGRTKEVRTGYTICSTPYVDLHFVRDLSIPIIAKLAELEKELKMANEKVSNFKLPIYVPAPKEPVKSNFFFGIGYKPACETYKEKLAAWEKDNEKYNEAKAKADANVAILKSNYDKIQKEIESLGNDNFRQSSLRQGIKLWESRPRRKYEMRFSG